jgi:hypothetical protein
LNGCVWVLEEFWNCHGMPKRRGCHFLRARLEIYAVNSRTGCHPL